MPQMRFEPMIPVFERAKTVHVLKNCAATLIGARTHAHNTHYTVLITCMRVTQNTSADRGLRTPTLADHCLRRVIDCVRKRRKHFTLLIVKYV
jgi:hypothetical protein